MKKKILVIDDESAIVELVRRALEREGYQVDGYLSVKDVDLGRIGEYNLIISDIMMPDADGYEFCSMIRDLTSCPILFLTAKVLENDIIYGLAVGADDYITKPFSIKELCARVAAHIRRDAREQRTFLYVDGIQFNLQEKAMFVDDEPIELTKSEYMICEYLAKNRGQVFSREQIFEHVFGYDKESNDITIAVHIKNIRNKLLIYNKDVIKTVWGIGYKWIREE